MAKVLIVDDSSIMRINMKLTLEQLGHSVIGQAIDGFDSIEKYEKLKPDFVTMDITMPESNNIEDGIEALVQIRKINPKAKVIMVTSHGEQDEVLRSIKNGASSYVLKPIDEEKLIKAIDKLDLK